MLAFVTPAMLAKGANGAYNNPEAPASVKALETTSKWIHHQCATNKGYVKALHSTIRYFPLMQLQVSDLASTSTSFFK